MIVADLMDDQLHDTDYLTKSYPEIPVLAVIPDLLAKESGSYYYRDTKKSSHEK